MKIIPISPFVPADLTMTLAEASGVDPAAWNSATAYTVDTLCSYSNKKYKAITANTNKTPSGTSDDSVDWMYIGNINKYALIDEYLNTQTSATGDLVIQFDTTYENSVYLANVDGSSIAIVQTVDGVEVYSKTVDLTVPVADFYDFFFSPIDRRRDFYFPLSLYQNTTVTITITGGSDGAKIGGLFRGFQYDLGYALWDTEAAFKDYSKYITNSYGNTYLNKGNYSKKVNLNYSIETSKIDSFLRKLIEIRGTMSVFIINENYDSLMLFGYVGEVKQTYNNPTMSFGSLPIIGSI